MAQPVPPVAPPATSIDQVIARMQAIDACLPADDGVACFNRMYLLVTQDVDERVKGGEFEDPAFVTRLDVVFANLYFAAVDALSGPPSAYPAAWAPLLADRAKAGVESIQFALAGMNAHINNDLPVAVVGTCADLGTAPDAGTHHADYQRVDALLDASEQSVRESFESAHARAVDRHVAAVLDLVCNWSMNEARDVAWGSALALWELRDHPVPSRLFTDAMARTVAMVSRNLLTAV